MTVRCKYCIHWVQFDDIHDGSGLAKDGDVVPWGECRRHAPRPVMDSIAQFANFGHDEDENGEKRLPIGCEVSDGSRTTYWPVTMLEDGCGEGEIELK